MRISRRASSVRGPVMTWTRWIPSRSAANTQIGRKTTSRCTYSPGASGGFSDRQEVRRTDVGQPGQQQRADDQRDVLHEQQRLQRFVARHAAVSG